MDRVCPFWTAFAEVKRDASSFEKGTSTIESQTRKGPAAFGTPEFGRGKKREAVAVFDAMANLATVPASTPSLLDDEDDEMICVDYVSQSI